MNGVWPIPPVVVDLNDVLYITIRNNLSVAAALHTHGLFQNKTFYQDGAAHVTECGIAPQTSYTYTIKASQSGCYWFHGHLGGHYVDGFRTPFIIRESEAEKALLPVYDYDVTLGFADWYHREHEDLIKDFLNPANPNGDEPIPASVILQNSIGLGPDNSLNLVAGKRYRIRLISMSAFAAFNVWIDGHDFEIFEVDGIPITPYRLDSLPLSPAQRYSILLTAKSTTFNYYLHADIEQGMLPSPAPYPFFKLALMYNPNFQFYPSQPLPDTIWQFDQSLFSPLQKIDAFPLAKSSTFTLNVTFQVYPEDGISRGAFNQNPYSYPRVPSALSALTNSTLVENAQFYGSKTSASVLKPLETVQIIINNYDEGGHPFHLHGHAFQVLYTGLGVYDPSNDLNTLQLSNPLRRDTTVVPGRGHAVLRFVADNPGVWLFHCHIECTCRFCKM